jgi:hypothetical protein
MTILSGKNLLILLGLSLVVSCGSPSHSSSELDAEARNYSQLQLWIDWYLPGGDYTGLIDTNGDTAFSPDRSTFVHFNGWAIGKGRRGRDFTTNYVKDGGADLHVTDLWLERDWNFAVVDWAQLSDEIDLRNAEAKIWTKDGPKKMRWMDPNGRWHEGPEETVAAAVANRLEPQLRALQNKDIIFQGHSFGGQLALAVTAELIRRNDLKPGIALPQQLILTDANFTKGEKSYLAGKRPLDLGGEAATLVWERDIPITSYKCTAIAYSQFGVDFIELLNHPGVLPIEADFKDVSRLDLNKRHRACKWKYLESIQQESSWLDGQAAKVGVAVQDKDFVISLIQEKRSLKLQMENEQGKFYISR